MKRIIVLILILMIAPVYALDLDINSGLKLPVAVNVNSPDNFNTWIGFQFGVIGFADVKWLDWLSSELDIGYTRDSYFLDEDQFSAGSFMVYNDWHTSLSGKIWIFPEFYVGLGIEFISQLSGIWGDQDFENEFPNDVLGTDTFYTIICGYNYMIKKDWNFIVELKYVQDMTIAGTTLYDIGIRIGGGYNFKLSF